MVDASEQVGKRHSEIRDLDHSLKRDLFLKSARFIVEDLNSTTIDLTRIVEGDVAEADWRRYIKGDRSIFTRALLRGKPTALIKAISEKVKQDKEARDYVTRYIEQFDRLLDQAKANDPEHLLQSTFMTADVGKLYVLLCHATGREEV